MRIDWIIAIFMFLMFSTWAFAYYGVMNSGTISENSDYALRTGEKVVSYLSTDFISNVAYMDALSDANNAVLWTYMNWTGDSESSTKVVLSRYSGSSVPCMISGDRLYWEEDLSAGDNFFIIERLDHDMPVQCSASLAETDDNQTELWPTETLKFFSDSRNLELCQNINSSYSVVKNSLGVNMNFNVLVDNGTEMTCGLPVPMTDTDVFAFQKSGRLWEGGIVNITVRLW